MHARNVAKAKGKVTGDFLASNKAHTGKGSTGAGEEESSKIMAIKGRVARDFLSNLARRDFRPEEEIDKKRLSNQHD